MQFEGGTRILRVIHGAGRPCHALRDLSFENGTLASHL